MARQSSAASLHVDGSRVEHPCMSTRGEDAPSEPAVAHNGGDGTQTHLPHVTSGYRISLSDCLDGKCKTYQLRRPYHHLDLSRVYRGKGNRTARKTLTWASLRTCKNTPAQEAGLIRGVRRITDPSGRDTAGVVTILASADHRLVTRPIDGAPCTSLVHTRLSQGGEGSVAAASCPFAQALHVKDGKSPFCPSLVSTMAPKE